MLTCQFNKIKFCSAFSFFASLLVLYFLRANVPQKEKFLNVYQFFKDEKQLIHIIMEEVQRHSVHTLVFRSLKRTHDMFVSNQAFLPEVDEEL